MVLLSIVTIDFIALRLAIRFLGSLTLLNEKTFTTISVIVKQVFTCYPNLLNFGKTNFSKLLLSNICSFAFIRFSMNVFSIPFTGHLVGTMWPSPLVPRRTPQTCSSSFLPYFSTIF